MRIGLLLAWAVPVATEGDGETVGTTSGSHAIKSIASPNHIADRPTTRTSRRQADRLSDCNSPGSIQHIVCCLHNKVSNRLCAKHQGIPHVRTVYEIAWDVELGKDPPDASNIVPYLICEKRRLRPSPILDLVCRKESMRVIEQELEQLELALGEVRFVSLMANHTAVFFDPQTFQLPDSLIPEVQPLLITLHLLDDDCQVGRRSVSRHHVQPREVALDPIEQATFESK